MRPDSYTTMEYREELERTRAARQRTAVIVTVVVIIVLVALVCFFLNLIPFFPFAF